MKKHLLILWMTLFCSHSIHSSQEAASSSVSSNPQTKLDTLLIINESELEKLFEKYKKPIVVKGVSKINKIQLTEESLRHVFGMHIKENNNKLKDLRLSGFHHDYNLELEDQIKPFYTSGRSAGAGVREAFIAYKRNQFPVFKTFFSCMLTREQVIKMLIESLHHIQGYEDQGKNMIIQGKALVIRGKNNETESVIINTVVNKQTKDIITFFPVTQKSDKEIQKEQQELNLLFKKFFFNTENKPERKPITKEEIEQLEKLYSDGIEVNWVILRDDLLYRQDMAKKVSCNPLYYQTPKQIKKINITEKSIQNVFSKENEGAFPTYLSRSEILEMLKDALQNIAIYEPCDGFREKGIHLQGFKTTANVLKLKIPTTGKSKRNKWELLIIINEETGDLEIFYPLFR